jgi:D-alanyl-D-alanine carboxypeptidase/D-alanyl-D-alanine-endopeptidase (penicillin-binding protein 4)
MWPAQSLQLVTAVSALDMLGADYGFHTSICYRGRIEGDILRGELYCVGGFDPTLTRDDLRAMADSIRRFGIRRIEGIVVADVSMKDTLSLGNGWCWDIPYERLTPLLVDRKNEFVGRLAREMLNCGIELDVTYAHGKLPQGCTEICRHRTPIGEVLKPMLKKADCLYAEAMFYQIAKANTMKEAKAADASRAIKRLVGRLGLDNTNYTFADGSGISLYSYVTAELMVRFLRHAADNQWMLNLLYPSLPIAGVDGTLRGRLTSRPCRGNVHAVAGGSPGVSTLTGYCRASNGHTLCFAIINQGLTQLGEAETFQDRVCQVLCR